MYRKEVQYIPTCDNIVQFKHEISHVMNLTNNKFKKKKLRDQFKERHGHLSWNTPSLSFWCWLCIIRVSPFCIRDLNVDCRILSEIQASELVVLKIKLVLCYLLFVGYFNICCKVVKTSFNSDFFLLTYGPCTHLINSTVFCFKWDIFVSENLMYTKHNTNVVS